VHLLGHLLVSLSLLLLCSLLLNGCNLALFLNLDHVSSNVRRIWAYLALLFLLVLHLLLLGLDLRHESTLLRSLLI